MKHNALYLVLAMGLVLLCACGKSKQPEEALEPIDALEISSFSFLHTASYAGDCFELTLSREDNGVHLYAEELFSGGCIVDTMIGEDELEQLGKLAGTYRMDQWNGFDKSSKHVLDGSSFTLSVMLADGSTISAHGNNAFPANYSEVFSAIQELYRELMEQHCPAEDTADD